jgi:hypothetical protein
MEKLSKLLKVNESITVNHYDNAWMVEIGGRDNDGNWKSTKTVCSTEEELIVLIKEWNTKDLDN